MMPFLLIFTFLLDGVLTNFLPFFQENLSFFTPYLSIVILFLIIPFFRKDEENKYYLTVMVYGFLYDIFYTNLFMTHVLLWLILAYIMWKIWKNVQVNYWTLPVILSLLIGLYHLLFMGLLFFFNLVEVSSSHFFYLWGHSLLLNILYGEILYVIFCKVNKKYRRMHLS